MEQSLPQPVLQRIYSQEEDEEDENEDNYAVNGEEDSLFSSFEIGLYQSLSLYFS
jgi:hypothetical protein